MVKDGIDKDEFLASVWEKARDEGRLFIPICNH
jgi:hypothetical protein